MMEETKEGKCDESRVWNKADLNENEFEENELLLYVADKGRKLFDDDSELMEWVGRNAHHWYEAVEGEKPCLFYQSLVP